MDAGKAPFFYLCNVEIWTSHEREEGGEGKSEGEVDYSAIDQTTEPIPSLGASLAYFRSDKVVSVE